jgi:thymidylate synthase (FAD)
MANVKLVGHTVPSEEMVGEGLSDIQEFIAFCARVSNPSNQMNTKTSKKLLEYLIKHAHWSPFEMAQAVIEIETTRDIARQMLRHRSFAYQEFSQRYADPTSDLGFVVREARFQDEKNRQNSVDIDIEDQEQMDIAMEWIDIQNDVIDVCKNAYAWAVDNGIAKEQARAVLPEGLTVSRMYMSGTIRSWIHYIDVRSANGTQKEHMEIANLAAMEIAKLVPMIGETS